MITYTAKISNYAILNNPGLPETCGHKHKTIQAADECRGKFIKKLRRRIGGTEVMIIENDSNGRAKKHGRVK